MYALVSSMPTTNLLIFITTSFPSVVFSKKEKEPRLL